MQTKYLHSSNIKELETQVNNFLEMDWEMFGPMLSVGTSSFVVYHQTLVKYKEKPRPKREFNSKFGHKIK